MSLDYLRRVSHERERKRREDELHVQRVRAAYYSGLRGAALRTGADLEERKAYKSGTKRRLGGRERL